MQGLMSNFYIWAFLSILTVVGTLTGIIGCIYGKRGNKKKELSYMCETLQIIIRKRNISEDLKITYKGQLISDVSVTYITIWNSGNNSIISSEVIKSKELSIQAGKNCRVLEAEIIRKNEETNNISISDMDGKQIKLSFDYIDCKEGIIIKIIHSGNSEFSVICKSKMGLEVHKYVDTKKNRGKMSVKELIITAISYVIVEAILIWTLFLMIIDRKSLKLKGYFGVITYIVCALFILGCVVGYIVHFVNILKQGKFLGVPKGLISNEDEN